MRLGNVAAIGAGGRRSAFGDAQVDAFARDLVLADAMAVLAKQVCSLRREMHVGGARRIERGSAQIAALGAIRAPALA